MVTHNEQLEEQVGKRLWGWILGQGIVVVRKSFYEDPTMGINVHVREY